MVFFEKPGLAKFDLPASYVSGFDMCRRDNPFEMTENVPTVLLSQSVSRERALYRHPELDHRLPILYETDSEQDFIDASIEEAKIAASSFRYRKAYDAYSLGIVLLEIGLWCPIKNLCCHKDSVETFRQQLHEKFLPEFRYRAGRIYYEVVKRCLEGGFVKNDIETDLAINNVELNNEAKEMRDNRRWLEAFERSIVSELEKCNV